MSEDTGKWIDWIKLPPRYLAAIAIATSILLFSPGSILKKIGLSTAINDYRVWFGLLWLCAVSLLLAHIGAPLLAYWRSRIDEWRWMKYGKRYLASLTSDEKKIMRGFITAGKKSQMLDIRDGNVKALQHERLIYQAASVGHVIGGFAFNIQPWVWDYLNKNQELMK